MKLHRDTRGATYVEFLIAFIPVFILFLGMLQAALLYAANLAVSHAATSAARSAVVVLPDDPRLYDGEPVNTVDFAAPGAPSGDAMTAFMLSLGLRCATPPAPLSNGSQRLNAIRSAASMPLLSVSPSFEQLVGDPEVYKAIGGDPACRAVTGSALYNRAAMSVTFPRRPGGREYRSTFGPDEDVTVRVTYFFHCGIPVANWYMCDDVGSLYTGVPRAALSDLARRSAAGADPDEISELVRRVHHSEERLRRARPGVREMIYAEAPGLLAFAGLTGSRFVVLRAEATMRNQGADYTYRGSTGPVATGP